MDWNNKICREDLQSILSDENIPWRQLNGTSILITGATGLIGMWVTAALLELKKRDGFNCEVFCHVRNIDKALSIFGQTDIQYICGDIVDGIDCNEHIDYIIHCASQTSSKGFVERPVETVETAVSGTRAVLDLARQYDSRVIFLSTMEVYGHPEKGTHVKEDYGIHFETMNVRNCYPLSKALCENLCADYHSEYNVPVNVVRLTQTFGPGVSYDDGRVFAEFMRCAMEGRDITLLTEGRTSRSYLYTADAVRAIFTVLLKGKSGQAYNAANEDSFCSIKEMAELVARECASGKIKVIIKADADSSKRGFASELHMNLDTGKLQELGWKASVSLEDMFGRMIDTQR